MCIPRVISRKVDLDTEFHRYKAFLFVGATKKILLQTVSNGAYSQTRDKLNYTEFEELANDVNDIL